MKNYLSFVNANPKTILLAPNAFKGSLEAPEFCRILSEELCSPDFLPIGLPMCDGGDGTASIIASYLNASPQTYLSADALGRPHTITYYTSATTGIIDLASVCGLKDLSPQEYDVLNANTAGLGKVLLHMTHQGIQKIILGVGGSASIDGGCGALGEMGLQIEKHSNYYRNHLLEIKDINIEKLKENFKNIEWLILCDVEHKLYGPAGAAVTFGPQKGATPLQVSKLDESLYHYASLLLSKTGVNVLSLKHGGAAGSIAAAFHALFGAKLISGAQYCFDLSNIRSLLPKAHCVITGEGQLDSQSLHGKLPGAIAALCHQYHIPVIGIAGRIKPPLPDFEQLYTLLDYAVNLPEALRQPGYYLRMLAKDLKRNILKL